MDPDFWLTGWRANKTAFHEGRPNNLLTTHFPALGLAAGKSVFVPLCGKSQDLHWLRAQGFAVTGAELSPLAVEQFFAEAGLVPQTTAAGALQRFAAPGITLFLGNIFDLDPQTLGPIDAVYDRAALVALPPDLRRRYAAHLTALTANAPQLLITFEYDQTQQPGPPFSIPEAEVRALYNARYNLQLLEVQEVPGGLRGICPATEQAWKLRPA